MKRFETNRFQTFYQEKRYLSLKKALYNYRLRRMAVEGRLKKARISLALEVGCGISPVMTRSRRVVYSDLSFTAMQSLKRDHLDHQFVVADAMDLPFRPGSFSHVIASEVLEHLEQDQAALSEFKRVLGDAGRLVLTFPHRNAYFAADDRFVAHFRRYELKQMQSLLEHTGLVPVAWRKVLGPLEKITMWCIVWAYARLHPPRVPAASQGRPHPLGGVFRTVFVWSNVVLASLAWVDARLTPRPLAAVLLVEAVLPPNVPSGR